MIVVIDVGNTNIVAGLFEGDNLTLRVRLKTDRGRTIDEYQALLGSMIQKDGKIPQIKGCVISSVVPPLTTVISSVAHKLFGKEPLIVGPGTKTGIALKVPEPSSVGADRVVNSLAAREQFGSPVVVVDFGTATTFDVVGESGAYEGGVIAPGIEIGADALVSHTAKLPRVELVWPEKVVGKTTVSAMQSGILIGYSTMVDGIVEKIRGEIGALNSVVATGGLGALMKEHSKEIVHYDPDLTLKGMKIIAVLNGLG